MKENKKLLIEKIIKKFFKDADKRITDSQRADLEQLGEEDIKTLLSIKKFPLNKKNRPKILQKISERILSRMEKRVKIYKAIKEAEEKGLYEAAEHFANKLDW